MKKISIYTLDFCPYCDEAKSILDSFNLEYEEVQVQKDSHLRILLREVTGSETLPQIFIEGELIGGCDDLKKLSIGDLYGLVNVL